MHPCLWLKPWATWGCGVLYLLFQLVSNQCWETPRAYRRGSSGTCILPWGCELMFTVGPHINVKAAATIMAKEQGKCRGARVPCMGNDPSTAQEWPKPSSSQEGRDGNMSAICLIKLPGQLATTGVRWLHPSFESSPNIWTHDNANSVSLCRLDSKIRVSLGSGM